MVRALVVFALLVGPAVVQDPVQDGTKTVEPVAQKPVAQDPLPTDAAMMLRIRVTGERTPQSIDGASVSGSATKPDGYDEIVTYGLEADRFYIDGEGGRRIYDRSARRVFALSTDGARYREESFFWTPDFLTAELVNRMGMAQMALAAGVEDKMKAFRPFEIEALFRAQIPDRKVDLTPRTTADGIVEFVVRGDVVTRWKPSEVAVPEDLRDSFRCMLSRKARLHPAIQAAILASGTVPQLLEFRNHNIGVKLASKWELVEHGKGHRPEKGWRAASVPDITSFEQLQNSLYFANGWIQPAEDDPQRVTRREFETRAKAAARRGDPLDAFLLAMEGTLQSGAAPTLTAAEVFGQASLPERVELFRSALMDSAGENPERAVAVFEKFDRKGLSRPHMIDVFLGTSLMRSGDLDRAEQAYWRALAMNPWLSAAYKDLGDIYRRRYDMLRAWQCFDGGRAVAPTHPIFQSIADLEKQLLRDRPSFF